MEIEQYANYRRRYQVYIVKNLYQMGKTRSGVLNLAKAVSKDGTAFDATDESGFDYN